MTGLEFELGDAEPRAKRQRESRIPVHHQAIFDGRAGSWQIILIDVARYLDFPLHFVNRENYLCKIRAYVRIVAKINLIK